MLKIVGLWKETQWKGQRAFVQEGTHLTAVVLPALGGKIASLCHRETRFEAAAQSTRAYRAAHYGADFAQYDASGLDDGFPTLHACRDAQSGFTYPDHGEIWSANMEAVVEREELVLRYASVQHPYRYEKRLALLGDTLLLTYHIENTQNAPYPCLWAFHGLFSYAPDMEILYPPQTEDFVNVLEPTALGAAGVRHARTAYDFDHVPPKTPPSMLKYYAAERVGQGQCGFYYPQAGMECLLSYDARVLPYLGVWINAGGFRGDYNCALEPCNGFYDDLPTARAHDALYRLLPGEPLSFSLRITLRRRE